MQPNASAASSTWIDQPLPVQYFRWLTVTLTGDLGTSIGTGRPVAAEVASAFGNTIILAIAATLFAFSLAVVLGTSAAYAKSRIVDRLVTMISLMSLAMPNNPTGCCWASRIGPLVTR